MTTTRLLQRQKKLGERELSRIKQDKYKPALGEPSPFGTIPEGQTEHPWVAWRRSHFSTPVGEEGDLLRLALCNVIEFEPVRYFTPAESERINKDMEALTFPSLEWVLQAYYCLGCSTFLHAHSLGEHRIAYSKKENSISNTGKEPNDVE